MPLTLRARLLRSWHLHALVLCLAGGGACVQPEHPCDPLSDPTVKRTAKLAGRVLDQSDAPVPGVTITVSGRAETTVSQEDGSFVIDTLPPNEDGAGYELVALPPEPLVGGSLSVEPLACYAELDGLVLRVGRPPATPEVELVQAVAGERLLVAFSPGEMGDDGATASRYRLELRTPFGAWQAGRVSCDLDPPLADSADEQARNAELLRSELHVDDACARALCAAYAYALPDLAEPSARCVHVVGWERTGASDAPEALHADDEFQIRVQAEVPVGAALVAQRIPASLASPLTPTPGRGRLLPLGQMPVALAPTLEEHSHAMSELDLECVLPTGPGRFAMVEHGALRVVGLADSVASEEYADARIIGESSMALDVAANLAANARLAEEEGETLAVLSAGRWLRVLRRVVLPQSGGYATRIKKVFIGAERVDETHGEVGVEPGFLIDVGGAGLRGFSWLRRPSGRLVDYRPADGYVLTFPGAVIVAEREDVANPDRSPLARNFTALRQRLWSTIESDDDSICGRIGSFSQDHDASNARVIHACVNLARGLHMPLRLSPPEILSVTDPAAAPDAPPVDALDQTVHVFLDSIGHQALVIPSDHLAGDTDAPLVHSVQRVPLGLDPVSSAPSRILSCADEPSAASAQQVLLVANAGSQDVSVLTVSDANTREVVEAAVVPLPAPPRAFLLDPDGPTCASPYAWILLEDGSVVPLDLRAEEVRVPRCGDGPCRIEGQGRVVTGAVSRDAEGRARVVLGGRAALAEVGYLRPARAR